jgi:hypothetical protein
MGPAYTSLPHEVFQDRTGKDIVYPKLAMDRPIKACIFAEMLVLDSNKLTSIIPRWDPFPMSANKYVE